MKVWLLSNGWVVPVAGRRSGDSLTPGVGQMLLAFPARPGIYLVLVRQIATRLCNGLSPSRNHPTNVKFYILYKDFDWKFVLFAHHCTIWCYIVLITCRSCTIVDS